MEDPSGNVFVVDIKVRMQITLGEDGEFEVDQTEFQWDLDTADTCYGSQVHPRVQISRLVISNSLPMGSA